MRNNQHGGRRLTLAALLFSAIGHSATIFDIGSPAESVCSSGSKWTIAALSSSDNTIRFGPSFLCRIPASGTNSVTLRFVEPGIGAPPVATLPGQRIFSVQINDATVIESLDLAAAAGYLVPYSKTLEATARNGFLDVLFIAGVRSAVVSAIEIEPVLAPPPSPQRIREDFTATAGQIAFTTSSPAINVEVFRNGLLQRQNASADYTTSVIGGGLVTVTFNPQTLGPVPASGDYITLFYYR